MIVNTIHLGVPLGLTSKLPGLSNANPLSSKEIIGNYVFYFTILFFIVSSVVTAILILFSDIIQNAIFGNSDYSLVYKIIILSVPLLVVYSIIEAFLRSIEKINFIVYLSIFSSIISTVILIPLIMYYNIIGVAIYLLLLGMIPTTIFFIKYNFLVKEYLPKVKIKLSGRSEIIKIGIVMVLSAFMQQGVLLYIRRFILLNFGVDANGNYQSVLGISINSFALVYVFLTNYTLPKLSSMKSNVEYNIEISENLRFLIFIIVPLVIVIFTFRVFLLQILYSEKFLQAQDLFLFQLIGDLFRALAALFGLWLISRVKVKQLILIDFIFNLSYFLLPSILLKLIGNDLRIISISYMIAFFIHFALYFTYTKFELKFQFSTILLRNILLSVLLIFFAFCISEYMKFYSYYLNMILLLIWGWFMLLSSERKKIFEKIFK